MLSTICSFNNYSLGLQQYINWILKLFHNITLWARSYAHMLAIWAMLRKNRVNRDISETALPTTISKFRKHFSIQTTPQNLGKITSESTFDHSKVVFRPFYAQKEFLRKILSLPDFEIRDSDDTQTIILENNIRPSSNFFCFWGVLKDCCVVTVIVAVIAGGQKGGGWDLNYSRCAIATHLM